MAETYMSMAQSENCRLVDASIQKNISFDGKPLTPTGWSGGMAEVFSLREQLKQAEEKAEEVQREVRTTAPPAVTQHKHQLTVFSRLEAATFPPDALNRAAYTEVQLIL